VYLSDTSPPLYYIALWAWTRIVGASDWSARGFSIAWAAACVPLIWLLARCIAGRRSAVIALVLFAFAPAAIFYSTEARMYSMLWFFVLATGWLTLRLHRDGFRYTTLALWILAAAAGLLTHYFFFFVLAAMSAWLMLRPGRFPRWAVPITLIPVAVLVFPWFMHVGASLGAWRVTQGWLEQRPYHYQVLREIWNLFWSYISPAGPWGGWGKALWFGYVTAAISAALLLAFGKPRRLFQGHVLLIWMWLAGALLGPPVFDVLRHSYTTAVPRYALAGLPAAILLIAALAASVRKAALRWLCVGLLVLGWSGGLWRLRSSQSRYNVGWSGTAQIVDAVAQPGSVVVIHSIPSGVVGIPRYMHSQTPVAGWVGQLGQRNVPQDIADLIAGYRRVILVVSHEVGSPTLEKDWLDLNARRDGDGIRRDDTRIYIYQPLKGNVFSHPRSIPATQPATSSITAG
jgi:4-amino-4-deoxy-L-arabinose transferase-like glycosyltransferase